MSMWWSGGGHLDNRELLAVLAALLAADGLGGIPIDPLSDQISELIDEVGEVAAHRGLAQRDVPNGGLPPEDADV